MVLSVVLVLTGCASHTTAKSAADVAGNNTAMAQVSAMVSALPLVKSVDAQWVAKTASTGPSAQITVATDQITVAQAHAIGLRIEKAVWLSQVAPIEAIDIYVGQVSANTDDAIKDNLLAAAQAQALQAKYGKRPVPLLPFVM